VGTWGADAVKELRGAVFRGDGSIVEVVGGRLNHEVLQLAGDGLVDAVVQGVPRAVELAEQCAAALRERAWEGDPELADQLQATLNLGPTPMLRPLAVDLEELASLLEGDPTRGGGRVDLKTGDCWPESLDHEDDGLDEEDEEDRWLYVDSLGAHEGYGDLELFIATVEDPAIGDRLDIAIQGRGAFRRFKDVLSRWPEELQRYFLFSAERTVGRARAWLAAAGYRPTTAAKR